MLPFVPRKVAKALKIQPKEAPTLGPQKPSPLPPTPASTSAQGANHAAQPITSSLGKGNEKETLERAMHSAGDYAALLRLTVSDYTLWCDADLRRNIEHGDDGFIPLSLLVARLPLSVDTKPPSETAFVKAIRAHASGIFEVRMRMTAPSRSAWSEGSSNVAGGYEVRLKDWRDALHRARNSAREEWETRTVYMENVPTQHRDIAGLYNFTVRLLPDYSTDDLRVQHISLPRHHLDKPNDRPKCKGFALVTLSQPEDVEHLMRLWPWQRPKSPPVHTDKTAQEAVKFGFRTAPKSHWEKLNSEYRAYRQRLLDGIAREEEEDTEVVKPELLEDVTEQDERPSQSTPIPAIDPSADYPPNCLVFARHVHPETNKTTLRKLFSQAFAGNDPQTASDGIDYVDFNKSMDTCYLRLAGPHYTQRLIDYFTETPRVQEEGLDADGTVKSGGKAITVEAVTGEREALYWGKVPQKVRWQAAEKAVRGGQTNAGSGEAPPTGGADATQPKRKRRRRG